MEKLIERARASMNLIGVFSALLAFSLLKEKPKIEQSAKKIIDAIEALDRAYYNNTVTKIFNSLYGRRYTYELVKDEVLNIEDWEKDAIKNRSPLREMRLSSLILLIQFTEDIETDTFTRFADCENADMINDFECAKVFDTSQEFLLLAYNLEIAFNEIKRLATKDNLDKDPTIGELIKSFEQVQVPILELSVNFSEAFILIVVLVIFINLYLISVVNAVNKESTLSNSRDGAEWIFFHPGFLGSFIGISWLLSPVVLLFLWAHSNDRINLLSLAPLVVSLIVVLYLLWKVLSCRKAFLQRGFESTKITSSGSSES